MTDREPDDLYDALRDRLADYGQEPPAPLWTSIRAQLPPPVAAPQLRRQRRWASVAVLLVLLAMMSGAGWQWWHAQQWPVLVSVNQQAESARRSTAIGPAVSEQAGTLAAATAGTSAVERVSAAAGGPASLPATGPPAAVRAVASSATAVAKGPNDLTSVAPAAVASSATNADSPGLEQLYPAGDSQLGAVAAVGVARHPHGTAETLSRTARTASAARTAPVAAVSDTLASRGATRRHAAFASRQHGAKPVANSPEINAPDTKRMAVVAAKQNFNSGIKRPNKGLRAPASSVALDFKAGDLTTLQPSATSSIQGHSTADGTLARVIAGSINQTHTRQAAEAGLLARLAALQPATWPAPAAPQLAAMVPSLLPKPLGERWAVQALLGPALTYRYLSAAPTAASPSPITAPTTSNATFAATAPIEELERPALGAGAQLSLRRALGKRWALSAGLGYAEYATRLALQQVPSAADTATRFLPPNQPAKVPTSIHRRDTYRFVTVPLRLAYTWTLTGRWRVGALAGVDAAFYVGGSSTEGSACACQAQTWGATGSPYRRFSLGASLGAEVRYRLTDRWELLAQPTASYLLSPLASASTGYYSRHLLGGTALLGASFDLP